METKLLLASLLCLCLAFANAQNNADGIKLETGGKPDKVLKSIYETMTKQTLKMDDTEEGSGSGDDDSEIYSGSGSGDDDDDDISTKSTLAPTKTDASSTASVIDIHTASSTPASTTREDNNVSVDEKDPTDDPNNVVESRDEFVAGPKSTKKPDEKSGGVKFTIGIIVGVVVGAVLAILVIVFLVYRLRKKDEGSYSLDEQSSQAFIRDDKTGQGKEYYA